MLPALRHPWLRLAATPALGARATPRSRVRSRGEEAGTGPGAAARLAFQGLAPWSFTHAAPPRLQFQCLPRRARRAGDRSGSPASATAGIELLADVPHAWPAGLLPGAEGVDPRGPRAARPRDLQHQRLHDERDRRPAAALLASGLDRPRPALPRDPPRAHEAGPAAGRRTRCAADLHRARRRDPAEGQTRAAGDRHLLRRDHARASTWPPHAA